MYLKYSIQPIRIISAVFLYSVYSTLRINKPQILYLKSSSAAFQLIGTRKHRQFLKDSLLKQRNGCPLKWRSLQWAYVPTYYSGVNTFCITKRLYGFSTSSAIISNMIKISTFLVSISCYRAYLALKISIFWRFNLALTLILVG